MRRHTIQDILSRPRIAREQTTATVADGVRLRHELLSTLEPGRKLRFQLLDELEPGRKLRREIVGW